MKGMYPEHMLRAASACVQLILREEWGFEGMVTSDWYTHGTQAAEIKAGNDAKMGCGTPEDTLRRIDVGELDPQAVRKSAERVLRMILRLS